MIGEKSGVEFSPPPAYGQNTRAVLEEIGFAAAEIDAMVAEGIASAGKAAA